MFLTTLMWIARARGRYGRALELGRRAIDLATEVDHAEFVSWATQMLGWSLLEVFAIPEAMEQLERSMEVAVGSGNRIEIIRAACHLPLARWLSGDHHRALEEADAAERLLDEVTAPPDRRYLQGADGPIALATLRIAAGDAERALELAVPVQTAALAAGWHEMVAGAALASGRAKAELDDPAGAVRALETAVDRAERCDIPGIAWRAHAELAAIGPAAARPAHAMRARELVEALSGSIEDASIRREFLEGALAQMSAGGGR
jgi:hypothetical protein